MGTLKAELMENESKFHLLHCQLSIADHNIKRVRGRGPGGGSYFFVNLLHCQLSTADHNIKRG